MLYYPQLFTGAVAQFPILRDEAHRTVFNALVDGSTVRAADLGAGTVRWKLRYSHLTPAESVALRTLFENARGRLNPFVFLDPTDNLLLWSSDLTEPAWTKDPLLAITPGQVDPKGGTAGFQLTNNGQAVQGTGQIINAPASLLYCMSLYARSSSSTALTVTATDQTVQWSRVITAGPSWTRFVMAGSLVSTQPSIEFQIQVAPGSQVSIYGMQVEAQRSASLYKATTDRSGVYPNTRFDSDVLELTSTGVNQVSATVRLVSAVRD